MAATARHARALLDRLEALTPQNPQQLQHFVESALGLRIPGAAVAAGSDAPFAYLEHAFFERGDCVVWASRGSGKTLLGAVATLLDLVFKPGIQIRILGGSFAQSQRMYQHLRALLTLPLFDALLQAPPTQRHIGLVNGSVVELLSQSERSVRGTRVHKLRCDEVEEFHDSVWDAAQLVTRTSRCGAWTVTGSIEALSTLHRPFGLMSRLVGDGAQQSSGDGRRGRGSVRVLRWCALDVVERCPPRRRCDTCALWPDCQGRARTASGFYRIDDLLEQRKRVSDRSWASEMMCQRPSTDQSVYPSFDTAAGGAHVRAAKRHEAAAVTPISGNDGQIVAGLDFGIRSPLVFLWARLDGAAGADPRQLPLHVFDEYVCAGLALEANLAEIARRGHPRPAWIGADPAGSARNTQSGVSDLDVVRRAGYSVRAPRTSVLDGVERVRCRLDHKLLIIAPRCRHLIASLAQYHFDERRPERDKPIKDGHDHACDALRYLVTALELTGRPAQISSYL